MGFHALTQETFLTQDLKPCLLCLLPWQMCSLPLAPPGKANYFSNYSPKEWNHISCCLVTNHDQIFCGHMDYSLPGSSLYGILQARILEWVAISFSRRSSWPKGSTHISCFAEGFFTTEPPRKTSHSLDLRIKLAQSRRKKKKKHKHIIYINSSFIYKHNEGKGLLYNNLKAILKKKVQENTYNNNYRL